MRARVTTAGTLGVALLAVLLTCSPAAAQVHAVQPGQRVRLTLSEQPREVEGYTLPQVLRGEVERVVGDSLWLILHPGTGPTRITLDVVEKFDVSRGVETWYEGAWRGGRKAGVTFALEFFLFRLLTDAGPFDNPFEAGLVGGGIGLIGGGILGGLMPQEIWHPLPWPPPEPDRQDQSASPAGRDRQDQSASSAGRDRQD